MFRPWFILALLKDRYERFVTISFTLSYLFVNIENIHIHNTTVNTRSQSLLRQKWTCTRPARQMRFGVTSLNIEDLKPEHSHQQDNDEDESKHNFCLHRNIRTCPLKTKYLAYTTRTSHPRICQYHLARTHICSLQHPQIKNTTTPLTQTHHAQLQ